MTRIFNFWLISGNFFPKRNNNNKVISFWKKVINFEIDKIMKKIYNSPVMDVVELKHQQTLLAGSAQFDIIDTPISAGDVDAPTFGEDLPVFGDDGLVNFAE